MRISVAESVTLGGNTLTVEASLSSFFSYCRVKKLGLLLLRVRVQFDAQLNTVWLATGRIDSDLILLTRVKGQLQIKVCQSKR